MLEDNENQRGLRTAYLVPDDWYNRPVMSIVLERRRNREDLYAGNSPSFEELLEEIEERMELRRQNGETGYISPYDDVWEERRQRRIGHIDLSDGMPVGLRELMEGFVERLEVEDREKLGRPPLGYIATLAYHPPLNIKGEANQPFLICTIGDRIEARNASEHDFNRLAQEGVEEFMRRLGEIIGETQSLDEMSGPTRMDKRLLKLIEQVPILRSKL